MADRTFRPRGQSDAERQRTTTTENIINRLLAGETGAARTQLQQAAQAAITAAQGAGATARPADQVIAEADSLIDRFQAEAPDSDQVARDITNLLENVNAPQHPAVQPSRREPSPQPGPSNAPTTSQTFNPEAAEFVPGQQVRLAFEGSLEPQLMTLQGQTGGNQQTGHGRMENGGHAGQSNGQGGGSGTQGQS